jgi:hypothetical protein
VDEACGLLRAVKQKLEKNYGFSMFGEFVANKVRDLNSSRLQSNIQHKIHTVLLEAEIELHNVPIHKEQTQLPVRFDSEPTSVSHIVEFCDRFLKRPLLTDFRSFMNVANRVL